MKEVYKPKGMRLKAIPEECYDEILRVQSEYKKNHHKQFSLEKAVYQIIKSTIKKEK